MPGYDYSTAPVELRSFLDALTGDLVQSFGESVISVMLHGSLAMGCFYVPKSDVDLLVVFDDLSEQQGSLLYDLFRRHHAKRPYVGGLEASAVRRNDARFPKHPSPMLVHFSETTKGPQPRLGGKLPCDEDLIAHFVMAKHRGLALRGLQPGQVIGYISWPDYVSSVRTDVAWILAGDNILKSPFYGVLNLCRWAMVQGNADETAVSKEEAACWALTHLPASVHKVITQALAAYRLADWPRSASERRVAGGPWNDTELLAFRDVMRF